ncbi:MAG: hypothetical protein ACI8V2_000547 [Candidatus Latescibacterota bacterium]|jgi:hypothetical protein
MAISNQKPEISHHLFNGITPSQSPFSKGGLRGIVLCLCLIASGEALAQSGLRKKIEAHSTPDRLATQALDKASNFSGQEMRMIDGRSVLSGPAENLLSRRSGFSPTHLNQLTKRSDFSASEMRMIQKRSETDATFVRRVQKNSTPDSRLRQRDQIIDVLFLKAAQKQSELNPEERRQLAKASDQSTIYSQLQRNSISAGSYGRLLSKRSIPESAWQRLLRSRSVD